MLKLLPYNTVQNNSIYIYICVYLFIAWKVGVEGMCDVLEHRNNNRLRMQRTGTVGQQLNCTTHGTTRVHSYTYAQNKLKLLLLTLKIHPDKYKILMVTKPNAI